MITEGLRNFSFRMSKKIAILATNGFEYSELVEPQKALKDAGYAVFVVSPETGQIHGKTEDQIVPVDVDLMAADPKEYDALVLPGGVKNPDVLRTIPEAVLFTKYFVDENKVIAAICHGPWTLINANGVKGKTVTSWPSLKMDLENAGATWVDQEVAIDDNLITSRKPGDIPAFNEALLAKLRA